MTHFFNQNNRKIVIGVLILTAILIRYAYIFNWHMPEQFIFSDIKAYHDRAQEMLQGHITKQDFFQPIGMTFFFISAFHFGSLEILSWIQLLASILTVILIWKFSENVFGRTIGMLTLFLATFHYPFIFNSGVYLSECLFTFFVALFMYLLSLKPYPFSHLWSFLLGFVFMLGFLLKGNFVLFVPLMMGWFYWVHRQVKPLIGFACAVGLVLVIHGVLTYNLIGRFQLSASNGGLNFIEGKCPAKINKDIDGYFWQSPLFAQLGESKRKVWDQSFTDSGYFMKQGIDCILADPVVLLESIRYIPYLFINNDLWPSLETKAEHKLTSRNYTLLFGFLALPAFIVGILLLLKNPRDPKFLFILLPVVSLCGLVWLFKGEMRFRVPFDVVILPLVVWGWIKLLEFIYPSLGEERRAKIISGVLFIGMILTLYGLAAIDRGSI